MTEISKTTREGLTLGLKHILNADFRCFKLDSYTDMSFQEGRYLSRIIGNRCRWPAPYSEIKREDQLEYTFLLSASLNTAKNSITPQQSAYFLWQGRIAENGRTKPVEATDSDLDGALDRVVIKETDEEKREYQLEEGLWFRVLSEKIHEAATFAETQELLRPIELAYQEALIASGIINLMTNDKEQMSNRMTNGKKIAKK